MDIRDRVLGPIASIDHGEISVDFGDFVRKLVLSEHFVLESLGLTEFPLMVRKFGYDGVRELLDSGLMNVQCELAGIASLRDRSDAEGELPPGAYRFGFFQADPGEEIEYSLRRLRDIRGLSPKKARVLCGKVADRIAQPPSNSGDGTLAQLHADIDVRSPILKGSVAYIAARYLARPVVPEDFSFMAFHITLPGPTSGPLKNLQVVQAESDLDKRFGLSDREVDEIIEQGVHSVGNLNQRLELMERFGAVTGFRSGELRLFERKLTFLARQFDPDIEEERFARVIDLAGLPDVDPDLDARDVDLSRLVEIVQRDEARAFRGWLRGIDEMSDQEIQGEINKLSETVRGAIQSPAGKVVRIGIATGVGLIPGAGLIAGPATSALDSFVVDGLISKPGPTAFVSHLYPSVLAGKGRGVQ